MLKSLNNIKVDQSKNYIVFFAFSIFFIIGCLTFKDYGISIDEPFHRLMGFYWLNNILEFFPNLLISEKVNLALNNIKVTSFENISRLEPNDFVYGIIFDVPLAFIEILFNINDSKKYFEIRHFFNFIFFFIGSIFFYKILLLRFIDWKISLIGTFFLILSPRIFANSFYNNKDLIFLSLFVISIFFALKLLKKINYINSINFSLFAAISTSSRMIGVATLLIFLLFYLISLISIPKIYITKLKYALLIVVFYFFVTFFLWPYLWPDPINNFISAFQIFSDYPRYMYILYEGEYLKTSNLPWHYSIKWIFITTPLLYLIFFIIGFAFILINFSNKFINLDNNNTDYDFWSNNDEKLDLFIFVYLFLFLFIVIKSNVVLYNGWRQLYFLYPLIIYISVAGIKKVSIFFSNKKSFIINCLLLIYLFYISIQIYLMHPYQNVYFNILAGNKVHQKYEVDYWGLSNKRFLEKINLIESDNKKINVGIASFTTMDRSLALLDINLRNKFDIVGQEFEQADYIFSNFMSEVNKKVNKKYIIPNDFELYDKFEINGIKLYEVYKKDY